MPKFYYVKSSSCPKSLRLSFLILLFPLLSYGQTLTGLWTGALHNDSSTVRKDQLFEIALTEYNGKVYGYSRSEFIVNDTLYYIVKRVEGTIEGDVCEVTDDEIVSYNFRGRLDKGIKVTSTFRRNQTDSAWYLDGTWKTNATKKYYSVTGKVTLSEEKDLAVSKLFPHLEELNLANSVAFYKERVAAPAVVRVATPTSASVTKPAIKTETPEPLSVSSTPTLAVPITTVTTEETVIAPVKRTDEELAKTETKNIPATTNAAAPQPPRIVSPDYNRNSTAAIIKKQPEATSAIAPADEIKEPVYTTIKSTHTQNTAADNKTTVTEKTTTGNTTKTATSGKPQSNTEPSITANNPVRPATANNNTSAANATTPVKQTLATSATPANKQPATSAVQAIVKTANEEPLAKSLPSVVGTTSPKTERPAEAAVKPSPDITIKAAVIAGRKSEFSQVVNFKSDSLIISLYDNGEIDGDTVSVFMNGQPLLTKQGLKSSAIKKTIYITPGQEEDFTLVMFAESLGKYPPNTGLLVIRDGNDIYNLRFSSDFEKNAGIVFRRKK